MISSVTLENFQGFAGTQTFKTSKFNLILGANSSGKTSIFRALELFIHSLRTNFSEGYFRDDLYEYPNLGLYFDRLAPMPEDAARYSKFASASIAIDVVFDHGFNQSNGSFAIPNENFGIEGLDPIQFLEQFPKFRLRIATDDPDGSNSSLFAPIDAHGVSPWELNAKGIHLNEKHPWWVAEDGLGADLTMLQDFDWGGLGLVSNFPRFADNLKNTIKGASYKARLNLLLWVLFVEVCADLVSRLEIRAVESVRPVIEAIGRGMKQKATLGPLDKDHLEKVDQAFKKLTGRYGLLLGVNASDLGIGQDEKFNFLVDYGTGSVQTFDNAGTGLSSLVPVLASIHQRDVPMLYIQEPESHLHPKMQGELCMYLYDETMMKKETQIFIETHSEIFLMAIQRAIFEARASEKNVSLICTETQEVPDINSSTVIDDALRNFLRQSSPNQNWPLSRSENHVFNVRVDSNGNLIDPLPTSFAEIRSTYLFGRTR